MILTKSAFATRMGVDRAQPTRWAARGMPVLPDGRVDATVAEQWVAATVDSTQRRRRSVGARNGGASAMAGYVPPFDCMKHLDNPADMGVVLFSMHQAYAAPANAAVFAVGAGASVEVARELFAALQIATMTEVQGLLDESSVPPPPGFDAWDGAAIWDVERFAQVDWKVLEAHASERKPGDVPPWRLAGKAAEPSSKSSRKRRG